MIAFWATGPRAVEDVWRDYVDPQRWSRWAGHIVGVRGLGSPVRPGDTGWVLGRFGARVQAEILEVDDERRCWSWRVGLGPARVRMRHRVEPRDGGSRATVVIDAPAALLRGYRPLAVAALRRLVGEAGGA